MRFDDLTQKQKEIINEIYRDGSVTLRQEINDALSTSPTISEFRENAIQRLDDIIKEAKTVQKRIYSSFETHGCPSGTLLVHGQCIKI